MINRKITILIILTIIFVGVVFLCLNKQPGKLTIQDNQEQGAEEQETKKIATSTGKNNIEKRFELVGIDENNWNIYRSEKYEFKVDHTLDYKIKKNNNQTIHILFNSFEDDVDYKNEIEIFIIETSIEKQRKRLENIFNIDKIFIDNVLLNNMQGEEYEYFDEMSNFHNLILLSYPEEKKNILWLRLISKNKSKDAINIFKSILNTFKLLK